MNGNQENNEDGGINLDVLLNCPPPPLEYLDETSLDPLLLNDGYKGDMVINNENLMLNQHDYQVGFETITTKKRKVEGKEGIKSVSTRNVSIEKKEIYFSHKVIQSSAPIEGFYNEMNTLGLQQNYIQQQELNYPCYSQQYSLQIGQQPPTKIVYNRILKPFPAVMLKENSFFPSDEQRQFFIDVFLIKNNEPNDILPFLDGKGQKPISNNNYCVFDKLKINSTSKSNKCQFRLKFQLMEFDGLQYNTIPDVYVISNPVEVFSHSNYLKEDRKSKNRPSPPIISMIIPISGSPGDRCVIIGANFINSKTLSVKFGDYIIKPDFHEDVTLVFNIPPIPSQSNQYEIEVSNDGEEYCGNRIIFTY